MEIGITPYVQHVNCELSKRDKNDKASLEGSVNMGLSRKGKKIEDNKGGAEAEKIRQECPPTSYEELRKKLCSPDEGPSKWGN